MTAFVSWSGGKDCTLALFSFLQNPENRVSHLVNFISPSTGRPNLRGIDRRLFIAQSKALNIPIIRETIEPGSKYEFHLKKNIAELKTKGVQAGVFGDIHLQEHRTWIERVCKEMDITPVFPLWGRDTTNILDEFADNNFRSIVIAVQNKDKFTPLLGKELNKELIAKMMQIQGLDLCGEHGEYHTFVFDGPIFNKSIPIEQLETYVEADTLYLPIKIKE